MVLLGQFIGEESGVMASCFRSLIFIRPCVGEPADQYPACVQVARRSTDPASAMRTAAAAFPECCFTWSLLPWIFSLSYGFCRPFRRYRLCSYSFVVHLLWSLPAGSHPRKSAYGYPFKRSSQKCH